MGYEYVTENNLEHRQYYNYSQFRGYEFLKEYFNSRAEATRDYRVQTAFDDIVTDFIKETEIKQLCDDSIILKNELENLITVYSKKQAKPEDKTVLDRIIKTFEVRKRLYHSYNGLFKPDDEADYNDLKLYLLASAIMILAYRQYYNLKYLNTLLKLNDILISRKDALFINENNGLNTELFWCLIQEEVCLINELIDKTRIKVTDDEIR